MPPPLAHAWSEQCLRKFKFVACLAYSSVWTFHRQNIRLAYFGQNYTVSRTVIRLASSWPIVNCEHTVVYVAQLVLHYECKCVAD